MFLSYYLHYKYEKDAKSSVWHRVHTQQNVKNVNNVYMAFEIGNLLGAASNLTSSFGKTKSLKSFLKTIDDFGIQVTNNFEVTLYGLNDITFFVQDVNFGGITQQFEEIHYNGRSLLVPSFVDYEHSGSMKVLNDANGYIYAAVADFLMQNMSNKVNNGVVMTIKCLTGDKHYKGSVVTLNSVRFEKVSGLDFSYNGGDVSTFSIDFSYIDFDFTPGALGKVAGVLGAAKSMLS